MPTITDEQKLTTLSKLKKFNDLLYSRIGKHWDYNTTITSSSDATKTYKAILQLGESVPQHYKLLICKDYNDTHNISEVSIALASYDGGQTTGYSVNSDDFYICWDETSEGEVSENAKAYLAVSTTNINATYYIKVLGDGLANADQSNWINTCKLPSAATFFWTGVYKIPNISTSTSNSSINEKASTTETITTLYGNGNITSSGYTDYIINNAEDNSRNLVITAVEDTSAEEPVTSGLADGIYRFSIKNSIKTFTLNDGGETRTFSLENGDIANGGLLTYTKTTVDGVTTAYFNYNAPQFKSSDNSIMIKYDSDGKTDITTGYSLNHFVTARHLLNYNKITGLGRKFYAYDVQCDLSGQTLRIFDNTDFADEIENGTKCTFNVSKSSDKQYLGFFAMYSSKGLIEFDVNITTQTGVSTNQKINVLYDTPSKGTFLFVTTMPFDIDVYYDNNNHYHAFIIIPENWCGTVTIQATKYNNYSGDLIKYFDNTTETHTIGQGDITLNTFDLSQQESKWTLVEYDDVDEIAGNFTSYEKATYDKKGNTFLPMGKYKVDGIGPVGEKEIGEIIPDWIVNDYILHTLNYELDSLRVLIEENELTNLASEDNSIIFTAKENSVLDLKVNTEIVSGVVNAIDITSDNRSTYCSGDTVTVPGNTTNINFSVWMGCAFDYLKPTSGTSFKNGQRITISGLYYIGNGSAGNFSHYYYQHIGRVQPSSDTDTSYDSSKTIADQDTIYLNNYKHGVEAFEEFMYWNGVWYDRGFVDKDFRTQTTPSTATITKDSSGNIQTITGSDTVVITTNQLNTLIGYINSMQSTITTMQTTINSLTAMTSAEIDTIYDKKD